MTRQVAIALAVATFGCAPSGERADSAQAVPPPPPATTQPSGALVATDTGVGAVRAGMTIADAAAALKTPAPDTTRLDRACGYAAFAGAPAGVRFMAVEGRIARIEVDSASVRTDQGVGVGDSEAGVQSAYGARVTTEPHKYDTKGHYLVVRATAPADSSYRLIFETDGTKVTRYRVGLMPQVGWVEGCA